MYRNSSSPANDDVTGVIQFEGRNNNSQDFISSEIKSVTSDVADGSEDGYFALSVMNGGSLDLFLGITGPETVINDTSKDHDFRVESNSNTHQLFVDAGTDNVMIGTSTNIDRWFNSAPGHSTIFQTSGFNDANRVNAFTHHSNDSGSAMVMLGKSRGGAVGYSSVAESDEIGQISFQGADGTDMVEAGKILVTVDAAPGANDMPGRMSFFTTADSAASSTERIRIRNNGRVNIGDVTNSHDGVFTTTQETAGDGYALFGRHKASSGTVRILRGSFSEQAPDDSTSVFITMGDSSTTRFNVAADGDVTNHDNAYGQISDERIKTNITDANSQWADIKAIKVKNFERKDDVTQYGEGKKVQIGVVAQEVETVSPGLIKEGEPTIDDIKMSSAFGTLYTADDAETKDGNDAVLYTAEDAEVIDGAYNVGDVKIKATHSKKIGDIKSLSGEKVKKVSYSVLYMKAIKALQEAQTRIETLETKVAALEG